MLGLIVHTQALVLARFIRGVDAVQLKTLVVELTEVIAPHKDILGFYRLGNNYKIKSKTYRGKRKLRCRGAINILVRAWGTHKISRGFALKWNVIHVK